MGETKRFFWLKLKEDFFRQKEIKKLRRLAGGDTFTIIYLKMLLRSLRDGGKLYYEGVEDNFASELALDIDEDEENVKVVVAFLMANNILTQNMPDEYELMTAHEMTDSECDSAARVRRLRERKALANSGQALLCNGDVTASNVDIDIENKDISIDTPRSISRQNNGPRKSAQPVFIDGFDDFWSVYPRKAAKSTAKKAWSKLKPDDDLQQSIIADVKWRVNGEWSGKDVQYIPHPTTYLNQRRWEDESGAEEHYERDLSVEEIIRRGEDCSEPEGFTPCGGW